MKKTNKKRDNFFILGYKISSNTFTVIIIIAVCTIAVITGTIYRKHILTSDNIKVVHAEIIDVGTHYRGGTRLKYEGYLKFRYYIDGIKIVNSYSSISIRDEVHKYHIGDCIELKVSLDNAHIYKWNEKKGAFKCNLE